MLTRLRAVLVILISVGTIFVVWNAVDAQLAAPPFPAIQNSSSALDRLLQEGLDDQRRHILVSRIWERAARAEFVLLAGGVCVWLLLPRPTGPPNPA
jgi:hypothetical protein